MPSQREMSTTEMLDTINVNKRLAVIEQILQEHGKVLDEIFRLHGQKQRHGIKTKRALMNGEQA
jgi:hypothetical protein